MNYEPNHDDTSNRTDVHIDKNIVIRVTCQNRDSSRLLKLVVLKRADRVLHTIYTKQITSD